MCLTPSRRKGKLFYHQLGGEELSVYQFLSPHRAFGLVKVLFSVWHGVEEMGKLGKFLEWMVQRALLLAKSLHAQLLGQVDIILGTVGGATEESGLHLWEEQG